MFSSSTLVITITNLSCDMYVYREHTKSFGVDGDVVKWQRSIPPGVCTAMCPPLYDVLRFGNLLDELEKQLVCMSSYSPMDEQMTVICVLYNCHFVFLGTSLWR